MKNLLFISVLLFFAISSFAYWGIERGTEPNEIYISSHWYDSVQCTYYGLYYSTNNGEDIELKYYTTDPCVPDSVDLMYPYLISDATPGVLYCRTSRPDLWISYNYGENWEFVENPGTSGRYTCGCTTGEIYKYCTNSQGTFYRSIDFGGNFEVVNDSAKYIMEVGMQEGELYGIDGNYENGFEIHYSIDYGYSFPIEIYIDSTIAGDQIAGFYPRLSRGTEQGEVYLITWHLPHNYYIYRSTDYGQSFELKYQSEPIAYWIWSVYYTAGREPGSFYIMMHSYDDLGIGTYLKIFYSNDYAETFTEYFHHLTEDYFVSVEDQPINQPSQEITLNNFPNPFNPSTTISLSLTTEITEDTKLIIYNLKGQKVKDLSPSLCHGEFFDKLRTGSIEPRGETNYSVIWNGKDDSDKSVCSGIYFYKLKVNDKTKAVKKCLLLK